MSFGDERFEARLDDLARRIDALEARGPKRGEGHGRAVLTEQEVRLARGLRATGISVAQVARRLGLTVAGSTLRSALLGLTWRHVVTE